MNEAVRFLHSLAQALSTFALYAPGHPATRRTTELLWEALVELLKQTPDAGFLFLGGAPVHEGRALHELANWPWSKRLAAIGVQRLEFTERVSLESLAEFVAQLDAHLAGGDPLTEINEELPGIRFGGVTVVESDDEQAAESDGEVDAEETAPEPMLQLDDELSTMAFVFAEAREGRIARAEADVVARLLGAQVERHDLPQVAPSEEFESYPEYLAINTALLAMATANAAGVDRRGRHLIGLAALLTDIGMMRLGEPFEQLDALPGKLRPLMETHPEEGARFLLEGGGRGLELAATVAFEHHLRPDGNGYPTRRFEPAPHWASRIVAVASAYGALRAERPFRSAWSSERALDHLGVGSGTIFDPEAAAAVAAVVRSGNTT